MPDPTSTSPPPPDWASHDTYRAALRECDLVLEGGIAGGVVYPRAVLQIARSHRLRSVGGASAGAIAGALAAAAEYARARGCDGPGQGFPGLALADAELCRPGVLRGLFAPRPAARPVVDFVARLFDEKARAAGRPEPPPGRRSWGRLRPWLNALRAFETGHGNGAILGAALGLLLAVPSVLWAVALPSPVSIGVAVLAVLGLSSAGAAIGSVAGAVDEGLLRLDTHLRAEASFGLCPGVGAGAPGEGEALFDWLHRHLQRTAGLGPDAPPLTFADLAGLPERREIHLRMVTANLNAQRAHRLPFHDGEVFVYRRDEMRALLPAAVWRAMEARAHVPPAGFEAVRLPPELGWLPPGDTLPVVVAVRLSMSFPLLFAAVRLDLVRADVDRRAASGPVTLDPATDCLECWFSDGGICNNFPLQFFDVWFPERPTFGLNLSDAPVTGSALKEAARPGDRVAEPALVELRDPADARRDDWPTHELRRPGDFLSALLETLLGHRDNALMRLASYRERVATVRLQAGEGSLHIDMPAETVERLAERGRLAAEALTELDFTRHQWNRLRMLLATLENEILRMQGYWLTRDSVIAAPVAGLQGLRGEWEHLARMARAAEGTPMSFYPPAPEGLSGEALDAWYTEMGHRVQALLDFMQAWAPPGEAAGAFFDAGRGTAQPPHPRGELRVTSTV